jgi:hypothetical protein
VFCIINFFWNWLNMSPPPHLSSWLRHCRHLVSACPRPDFFPHYACGNNFCFRVFELGMADLYTIGYCLKFILIHVWSLSSLICNTGKDSKYIWD